MICHQAETPHRLGERPSCAPNANPPAQPPRYRDIAHKAKSLLRRIYWPLQLRASNNEAQYAGRQAVQPNVSPAGAYLDPACAARKIESPAGLVNLLSRASSRIKTNSIPAPDLKAAASAGIICQTQVAPDLPWVHAFLPCLATATLHKFSNNLVMTGIDAHQSAILHLQYTVDIFAHA